MSLPCRGFDVAQLQRAYGRAIAALATWSNDCGVPELERLRLVQRGLRRLQRHSGGGNLGLRALTASRPSAQGADLDFLTWPSPTVIAKHDETRAESNGAARVPYLRSELCAISDKLGLTNG